MNNSSFLELFPDEVIFWKLYSYDCYCPITTMYKTNEKKTFSHARARNRNLMTFIC